MGSPDDLVLVEPSPEERAAAREARERRRERRRRHRRRRRIRRILVGVLVVLAVLATAVLVWFRYTLGGLDRIPGSLPAGPDTPGTTILLVGSDPGAHDGLGAGEPWRRNLRNSDLVMLVHLPVDREAMYAISVPASTRLELPGGPARMAEADGSAGYVEAVQDLTGAQVDQFAVLDLNGVRAVVDDLEGVRLDVTAPGCGTDAGPAQVDGQAALDLVRLRPCLPHGDLDRVSRQQSLFKGMLTGLIDGGVLTNPLRLNDVAKSTFDHLAVNEEWSWWEMGGVAWSMRTITPRTTTFLTVPTRRVRGDLVLDKPRAAELWQALREDRVGEYAALNQDTVAGGS